MSVAGRGGVRLVAGSGKPPHLPEELWKAECRFVHERRTGERRDPAVDTPPSANVVGLAISGGGIRSATVALGVLQGLAQTGILRFVDYVSTVSGGGYIGTFLGGVFKRWGTPAASAPADRSQDWERVKAALTNAKGHPIDWLRENGRYLAPNGAGDLSVAAAVVLRNLLAVHVVLGTLFLTTLLAANGLRVLVAGAVAHFAPDTNEVLKGVLVGPEVWWSPIFLVPVAIIVLWGVPAGIAYWLVRSDEKDSRGDDVKERWAPAWTIGFSLAVGVAVWASAGWLSESYRRTIELVSVLGVVVSAATLILWFLSRRLPVVRPSGRPASDRWQAFQSWVLYPRYKGAWGRNYLTLRLRTALVLIAVTSVIALVDSLGQTIYVRWQTAQLTDALKWLGGGFASVTGIATLAQRLGGAVNEGTAKRPKLPLTIVAGLAAAALVGVILVSLATVAHLVTWAPPTVLGLCGGGGEALHLCTPHTVNIWLYAVTLTVGIVLTAVFGQTYSFVNRSSLATLYGDRLARAYLGASNEARERSEAKGLSILLDGDEIDLPSYRPHQQGGPLHLINVTLNETAAGRSQVEQLDRKGLGMAIGPAGVSVGVSHHATWAKNQADLVPTKDPVGRFRVFPADTVIKPRWPTLGRWMAISGAAVSTGLGSRTSLSLSILIGLFNFRLGHWWRSGVDPTLRPDGTHQPSLISRLAAWTARRLPVHAHLVSELVAHFPGTSAEDWYLTDGGHFENSGAYELIRRRVPFIILCDNGADPEGNFDDLGNLVRKVRTDFGASIRFLDRKQIGNLPFGASVLGPLEDLGFKERQPAPTAAAAPSADPPGQRPRPRRYAALAEITYDDGTASALLLLRPSVLGNEPADILSYHAQNASFPQQSTGDQFFDEAQWESYRRLGEVIAETVFKELHPAATDTPVTGWQPVFGIAPSKLPGIHAPPPTPTPPPPPSPSPAPPPSLEPPTPAATDQEPPPAAD